VLVFRRAIEACAMIRDDVLPVVYPELFRLQRPYVSLSSSLHPIWNWQVDGSEPERKGKGTRGTFNAQLRKLSRAGAQ